MMPVNKGEILLSIARSSIAETLGQLLSIARSSIAETLGQVHETAEDTAEDTTWLQQKAACFVTLTQQGQLRGCIGTLEAHRPLLQDVKSNANAAAFHDTRFSPLTSAELNTTEIEISLLSSMQHAGPEFF
jgi:AmmeMemoRadiSam system protein A